MTQTIRLTTALSLTLFLLLGCGQAPTPTGDMTQLELSERISNGTAPVILDVRSADEFAAGHLPDAINIPHAAVGERVDELGVATTDEIVVHCYSGKRAGIAQTTLDGMGFTNLRHLDGDWQGWPAAGLPIE
jgi:phage shock protein E